MTRQPGEPGTSAPARGAPGVLPAGRVGRPHGLDGSFYVTRPRPRLLSVGVAVTVAGRSTTIVRRAGTEQRPIVRAGGRRGRPAAEALRGVELLLVSADAPVLGEGEWWAHELEGCAVVDGQALLGTVSRLLGLPSCEVLEVARRTAARRCWCRWSKTLCAGSSLPSGRIEVDLGFLGAAGRALPRSGVPGAVEGGARSGGADVEGGARRGDAHP